MQSEKKTGKLTSGIKDAQFLSISFWDLVEMELYMHLKIIY